MIGRNMLVYENGSQNGGNFSNSKNYSKSILSQYTTSIPKQGQSAVKEIEQGELLKR